jgi:hypothetical protein
MRASYRRELATSEPMALRASGTHPAFMRGASRNASRVEEWKPAVDPDGTYSSGIADFDQLIGGGYRKGTVALVSWDETVGTEDLDLLLFPTILNMLYHSRGLIAVLPARDSPHGFRERLTRYVTRRRFDSRVRVVDYAGEDEGLSYVVTITGKAMGSMEKQPEKEKKAAVAKLVEAERAVAGNRKHPFLELYSLDVMETLMGPEEAATMFFHGAKRSRYMGNLLIALLGPGLGSAVAARKLADNEFQLHHDDVGLVVRGTRPPFPGHVVTTDTAKGPPHVLLVPRPTND